MDVGHKNLKLTTSRTPMIEGNPISQSQEVFLLQKRKIKSIVLALIKDCHRMMAGVR